MLIATAWLGTLPSWLLVLGLMATLYTVSKGSRSTAVQNLRAERDELDREVRKLTSENTALKATRDLAPLQSAMVEQLMAHEERAGERFDKTMSALDQHLTLTEMIAKRLGPDNGH